jgi:hypothetical protein
MHLHSQNHPTLLLPPPWSKLLFHTCCAFLGFSTYSMQYAQIDSFSMLNESCLRENISQTCPEPSHTSNNKSSLWAHNLLSITLCYCYWYYIESRLTMIHITANSLLHHSHLMISRHVQQQTITTNLNQSVCWQQEVKLATGWSTTVYLTKWTAVACIHSDLLALALLCCYPTLQMVSVLPILSLLFFCSPQSAPVTQLINEQVVMQVDDDLWCGSKWMPTMSASQWKSMKTLWFGSTWMEPLLWADNTVEGMPAGAWGWCQKSKGKYVC